MRRILVATDLSARADHVFEQGLDLARRLDAEVVLFHALSPLESDAWSPLHYSPEEDVLHDGTNKIIQDLLAGVLGRHDAEGVRVHLETWRGAAAAPAIVACARTCEVDLILMGTHRRGGLGRALLGSVAEEVVRTAACPVLLAREAYTPALAGDVRRVLVPLDFSPCSELVLPWAQQLAAAYHAQLILLHVVEDFPLAGALGGEYYGAAAMDLVSEMLPRAEAEMEALVEMVGACGVDVTSAVEVGHVPVAIVDRAMEEGVDLIAMSSHGRTGLSRFLLGSIAEKVARTAVCPVLVVNAATHRPAPADRPAERPGAAARDPLLNARPQDHPLA